LKKTFAIVLLIAHLFNLGGYMLLSQYLVYKSDKFAAGQIRKGFYDNTNLIEIKVPQHMPQVQNWKSFARVSGQIQLKGVAYNYVKLKVTQDTLYVQCVPNYQTTKLLTQNVINAKQLSDIPVSKKSHESSGKKSGIDNKYDHPAMAYSYVPQFFTIQNYRTSIIINIDQPFISTDGRPPELAA
jgi:hypothetical protein